MNNERERVLVCVYFSRIIITMIEVANVAIYTTSS